MTIAFSCRRCATRFKVSDRLAGKKARCKKCGGNLLVPKPPPTAASVAASGLFRMGTAQPDPPPSAAARHPASKPPDRSAAPASLGLVPISEDNLKPVARGPTPRWDDDDSIEYEMEKPAATPAGKRPSQLPPSRRQLVWGRGGIAEALLIALRKISDFAYLISMPFLLLILLAIVLKQRELAVIAAVCVIVLNVVRLGLDGFVLFTLAFKKGPLHGVLFFIPPFTFYYLNTRGKVIQEALRRFLGPALPIAGVVLLFIFVPWLRGGMENQNASLGDRLRKDLDALEQKIQTDVLTPHDSKN